MVDNRNGSKPTDLGLADASTSVTLEGVSKRFGSTGVLDRLNLRVEDRELLVVLGPSGCGKTTTLNIMAGLETIDSGRVFFGSEDVTSVPPERRCGLNVFPTDRPSPHPTVCHTNHFP